MGISLDGLASGLDTTALISSIMQVGSPAADAAQEQVLRRPVDGLGPPGTQQQSRSPRDAGHRRGQARRPGPVLRNNQQRQGRRHHHCGCQSRIHRLPGHQAGPDPGHRHATRSRRTGWPYTTMTINSGGQTYTIAPLTSNAGRRRHRRQRRRRRRHRQQGRRRRRGDFRLQFTATKSGDAGAFTISDPGTTFTDVKAAQDAEIPLWPGTAAAQRPSRPRRTPSRTCSPAFPSPPKTSPPHPSPSRWPATTPASPSWPRTWSTA